MAIQLVVNGKPQSVDVPPNMPLLWVLRDALGMTGTKFGCGMALCGACTVHVDGEATRSCITPASSVVGKKITTIEGLSTNRSHPVQRAWIEVDVPQCGYCQSGQIMSAVSLLAQNPKPSDADIDAAMKGNICRCGTYHRIREAVHRAAALHEVMARPVRIDELERSDETRDESTVSGVGLADRVSSHHKRKQAEACSTQNLSAGRVIRESFRSGRPGMRRGGAPGQAIRRALLWIACRRDGPSRYLPGRHRYKHSPAEAREVFPKLFSAEPDAVCAAGRPRCKFW